MNKSNRKYACVLLLTGMVFTTFVNLFTREEEKSVGSRNEESFKTAVDIGQEGTLNEQASNIPKQSCNEQTGCGNPPGRNKRRILIGGDHCIEYDLQGTLFGKNGATTPQKKVKMCHLKTFDTVDNDTRKAFIEFRENLHFILQSPSFLWLNDKLVMTLRLMFQYPTWRGCFKFLCNHIVFGYYDDFLNPIGQTELITLRTPMVEDQVKSGPHDGKLFQINGALYSLFATGYRDSWISSIWDYKKERFFTPKLQNTLLEKKPAIFEKNWVPVIIKGELYIIRFLDPLQVMKCSIHEGCTFVKNNTDALKYEMDEENTPLRGGTKFELYKYPYYIGIAHGTYINRTFRRYEVYLVVLCVDPFRVVYVSDPLKIHSDLFRGKKPRWKALFGDFIFPTGLILEGKNSVVIGAHANDVFSMVLRLEGIQPIVEAVMNSDKDSTYQNKDLSIQKTLMERARDFSWT